MPSAFDIAPSLRYLRSLISLMRPMNALVSFAAIVSVATMAAGSVTFSPVILLAGVAGMLVGSWGNIINDVYDVEIDRMNKPHRAIAAGAVSRNAGTLWAAICALTGLALSIPLGLPASLIAVATVAILFLYSAYLKRLPLIGNVVVGIVTGAAFIYGGYAVGNPRIGLVPAVFACLMNIGRELLKDIEDVPGDRGSAHRTFPIVAGERSALWLATAVLITVGISGLLPFVQQRYGGWFLPLVLVVDAMIVSALILAWRAPAGRSLHHANLMLKWGMLTGIVAFAAGSIR